jgi:hypothetical protein
VKLPYEPPEIEITTFEEEDIITVDGLGNFAGYHDD